jgi:dihydrofolate synthase / folylpolyglutamate synthase
VTSFARVCAELDRRRHVTLGFDRIEALLGAMGHPDRAIPNIAQVVGTNGKGTTAVALAIALEELGHPSGAFLSPHVLSYTERVVLRGRQVSEEEFAAAMGETMELADRHGIPASQFEILTAGALKMFAEAGLSWVVLEAGLGARHDATSVARPDAVVLTNVAIDHTEYLGETIEEISEEKLASLRPGATLFLGTEDERVVDLARNKCRRLGVDLVEVGRLWKLSPRRVLPPTWRAPRTWGSLSPGLSSRRVSPPGLEKGSLSASAKRFLDGSRCTRSVGYPSCLTGGTTRPGSRRRSRPCGALTGSGR